MFKYFLILLLFMAIWPQANAQELSAAQKEALQHLREEEKMTHDLYTALFEAHQLTPHGNIRQSEGRHMERVKVLLDQYGIAGPAQEAAGKFTNAELQKTYDEWLKEGKSSPEASLRVGVRLEEMDIQDLDEMLTAGFPEDVNATLNDLQRASRNHLRAFMRNLQKRGHSYTPEYLSPEAFQAIVDGEHEAGRGHKHGKKGKGKRKGKGKQGCGGEGKKNCCSGTD